MSLNVITFGCRLNAYESEQIKKAAESAGLENAVIFNSCAVTSESERQLRQSIRKIKKQNPDAKIIVTGCAAQISPDNYHNMEEVDYVIGNAEKANPKSYILNENSPRILVNDIFSIKETASAMVDSFDGKARAFLQIQNGCNHRCTFCIIPFGRGNSRSVPPQVIIEHSRNLLANGYQEIVLTGVDISDYGKDLEPQITLAQMIKRLLAEVPELIRLRLSSIDVAEIDYELLNLLLTESRIMPYLHISLQAGDDMILKRMKRRHNRQQVLDFCHYVRARRPEVTFGADIIAGFPTESDEMFENTRRLIEEAKLTFLHVFPYSERKGTPAARMPQVAKQVRKERARILREIGARQVHKHYFSQIGKILRVVVESDNMARAEDFSYVKINSELEIGSTTTVRAVDCAPQHIISEIYE